MSPQDKWKLDKHVPLALLAAIALQTTGIVWFASKLDSRVGALETEKQVVLENRKEVSGKLDDMKERLVRIETLLSVSGKQKEGGNP